MIELELMVYEGSVYVRDAVGAWIKLWKLLA
jgi:hypothetical protein